MNTLFVGKNIIEIGEFKITFYAVAILLGAILAYKLSQYFLKKKGYDPEALENLFYVAFPAGIIGARVWWIIAEGKPFEDIYKIWEGGLAIQGGVLFGALAGIIFMLLRRKNIPLLLAADCIVPTILLAQAVGRWGNYFNQEVYGNCVDRWTWLPDFFTDRLSIQLLADGSGWATSGGNYVYLCEGGASQMVVPLFLIESVINTIGFFIIVYDIPKLFKYLSKKSNGKVKLVNGDLMGGYFIWYGVVRAIMEPLRNTDFIMGTTDPNAQAGTMTSVQMSILFIILGIAIIIFCHLYDKFGKKRKILDTNVITGSEAELEAVSISEVEENKQNNVRSIVIMGTSLLFLVCFISISIYSLLTAGTISVDTLIIFFVLLVVVLRIFTLVNFSKGSSNEVK